MYEFEVLLKNGERTFIWGYNYQDALNRHPKLANEIESLLFQEYIDWPPIWEVSFSLGWPLAYAAASFSCQQAICTIFHTHFW